jgi:uncharacterized protein (DUF1810 family)
MARPFSIDDSRIRRGAELSPRSAEIMARTREAEMEDSYDLERFVYAQTDIYDLALAALWRGTLPAEWVGRIFPPMATNPPVSEHEFALGSIDQAEAYLEHPVLGSRYREAAAILETHPDCTAQDVFGAGADAVHSSLTLFALATSEPVVRAMLSVWFSGLRHERTMAALGDDW